MYTAVGTGVQRNDDGSITVAADIKDDGTGRTVLSVKVQGKDVPDVKAKLLTQVQQLIAARTDAQLSTQVVGQTLASV